MAGHIITRFASARECHRDFNTTQSLHMQACARFLLYSTLYTLRETSHMVIAVLSEVFFFFISYSLGIDAVSDVSFYIIKQQNPLDIVLRRF